MTKAELLHGRGTPMSAYELCVEWPLYRKYEAELARRLGELEGAVSPEEFDAQHERLGGGG